MMTEKLGEGGVGEKVGSERWGEGGVGGTLEDSKRQGEVRGGGWEDNERWTETRIERGGVGWQKGWFWVERDKGRMDK